MYNAPLVADAAFAEKARAAVTRPMAARAARWQLSILRLAYLAALRAAPATAPSRSNGVKGADVQKTRGAGAAKKTAEVLVPPGE